MRKLLAIIFILLLSPFIWLFFSKPTFEHLPTSPVPLSVQKFTEIKTPFSHIWHGPSHPFTGAAVIDIDGDGRLEIFVGGGRGQEDMLLSYKDGALVDISKGKGLSDKQHATHGMASTDMDGDGDVDLVVARENGLTLYINESGTFLAKNIPLAVSKDSVPLSVAISDVNEDGFPDIYVSVFVSFSAFKTATFNDPEHAKKNVMLINKGEYRFQDETAQTGTAGLNNTFHSVFADLNRDGKLELVLSQNTGEIEIFTPGEQGQFKSVATGSGYGFWMGLAIADFDKDGDEDIFASNIGTSIPDLLTNGDLRENQRQNTGWGLFEVSDDLKLKDITNMANLHQMGFAWGAQFEDLNLDGELDLIVAQNYIKWFLHKFAPLEGKALLQVKTDMGRSFYQSDDLGLGNPHYAQSPVIMDIDGDGRADLLWLNMDGPLRAFLNRSKGSFITFDIPDSPVYLGAVVTITTENGQEYSRQVIPSTGLMTDPTPQIHFGLDKAKSVISARIKTVSGAITELKNPDINKVHKFRPVN